MIVDEWGHKTSTATAMEKRDKIVVRIIERTTPICAKFTLSSQFEIGVRDTYKNTKMITNGINKISDKAANRKMFDVWSSTSEIIRRAPHHEF